MINFIKWGFKHEDEVISLFFSVVMILTVFGWSLGILIALAAMNLKAILVLLLPIIYALIELYKLYRQELCECDK